MDVIKETLLEHEDTEDFTSNIDYPESSSGIGSAPSELSSIQLTTSPSMDSVQQQPFADSVGKKSVSSDPRGSSFQPGRSHHSPVVRKKKAKKERRLSRDSLLEEEDSELQDSVPPNSPLYNSFANDDLQGFKQVLESGADPDELKPLHLACERGCTDFVKLLIEYNANINLRDDSGNLPLNVAARKGHKDIVQQLLKAGALVDEVGAEDRTPLHDAADAGNTSIVELLIREGAILSRRDSSNATPYGRAFEKGNKEVMDILKKSLPKDLRPYTLLDSEKLHESEVTALAFRGLTDVLISGSKDCHVSVWDTSNSDCLRKKDVVVSNTVLAVDTWRHYLAIGSTSIQLVDVNDTSWRRSVTEEDENAENPPLHFVAFEPRGTLATASVEGNLVKLWSLPFSDWQSEPQQTATLSVGSGPGCIRSLVMSPDTEHNYLAVGIQPGKQFQPVGNMQVHLFNWKTETENWCFDTGYGGRGASIIMAFSQDGLYLAFGHQSKICILETSNRQMRWTFSTNSDIPLSSLSYSPNGVHISAGMKTGEVQVFGVGSGICEFTLESPESPSEVTAVLYSSLGKRFAVGHSNGTIRLWEAYTSCIPPDLLEEADSFTANPLLVRQGVVPVNSNGVEFHSSDDDFSLIVPKGALKPGIQSSIRHGVVRYGPTGPFEFPEGWRAVSPIVYFCFSVEVEFTKPATITMPHCFAGVSSELCNSLSFLKASHNEFRIENGEKVYSFKPVNPEEEMSFLPNTQYGSLHPTHFCYYCIAFHDYSEAMLERMQLILVIAKPLSLSTSCQLMHGVFCLMYDLKT